MVWIFAALVLGLFIYEGVALYENRKQTISELVWGATTKRPLIPFMFGMLMGHFFWRW